MDQYLATALVLVGAYLVGGIPFGYLLGRWRGVDLFQAGSGNIGATNVGRVLGWRLGVLVFGLDFAKGAVPVTVAQGLSLEITPTAWVGVSAGLAAFLGHLFPIYLRFRGGKGVATGAGAMAVLLPGPTAGALFTWLAVVCATRFISLASLAAALALCGLQLRYQGWSELSLFCAAAAAMVFVRHRGNIKRLWRGQENRLPESATMLHLTKIIHLLALGLWFGSNVFFTFVAAPVLFQVFAELGQSQERPLWFPCPPEFKHQVEGVDGPREQGLRAVGQAVSSLFPWFFLLQGLCGLLALSTALGWSRAHPLARVHGWRTWLLFAALVTVLIGWPLERHVHELRIPRHQAMELFLKTGAVMYSPEWVAMEATRRDFGLWHTASLFLNFLTVALVTGAMVLASWLPARKTEEEKVVPPGSNDPRGLA